MAQGTTMFGHQHPKLAISKDGLYGFNILHDDTILSMISMTP